MLEWMVSSSLLILAVLAARRLLRDRISGTVRYGLWLVVLVRLLVPVSLFSAPVSLEALLPDSPAVEEALGQTALYAFPDPERSGTFDEPLPEDVPTGVLGCASTASAFSGPGWSITMAAQSRPGRGGRSTASTPTGGMC